MKKIVVVLALLSATFLAHATPISQMQALNVASQFFAPTGANKSYAAPLPLQWVDELASPAFYAFNRGEEQGFVVVAGDDSLSPILAYAYEGSIDPQNLPLGLKAWMQSVRENVASVKSIQGAWKNFSAGQPVVELETPNFDQEWPYNLYCPVVGGIQAPTGCTITATCIIMAYYQWPDAGVGQLKAYTTGEGYTYASVDAITLGHPYEWSKMPYVNGNHEDFENPEQQKAVATLMRDVGSMARTAYTSYFASAMPSTMVYKLPKHMKYAKGIMQVERQYFSLEAWKMLLKEELEKNRPMLMEGYTDEWGGTGHSFVIDGYDDQDLFAVNWGWGGRSNGFYNLDSMNPYSQGAGGAEGGYKHMQAVLMRMLPNLPQYETYEERFIFTPSSYVEPGLHILSEGPVETGKEFELTAGRYMNLSSFLYDQPLRLVVTTAAGKEKEEICTTASQLLDPGTGAMPLDQWRDHIMVTLTQPIAQGDRIRLLYYSPQEEVWKPVQSLDTAIPWEIVLKEDVPTDVEEVTSDSQLNGPMYDLSGRLVSEPIEGQIYIQNGKKFIY